MTTWNPSDKSTNVTLSNGNLTATGSEASGIYFWSRSTTSKNSGKHYLESTVGSFGGGAPSGGFAAALGTALVGSNLNDYLGQAANTSAYYDDGSVYVNNAVVATLAAYVNGDVIGLALDLDAGKGWYSKNGVFASGNPAAGTGAHFTFTAGTTLYAGFTLHIESPADQITTNFGATAFNASPPSGFIAWDPTGVNTADKRRSILLRLIPGGPHTVDPDGTLSVNDRIAIMGLYSGAFADAEAGGGNQYNLTYGMGVFGKARVHPHPVFNRVKQ